MLSNRRNAGSQTARQPDKDVLDRRRTAILGCEDLGMVGIELKCSLATLLFAQPKEAFDRRVAMRAVLPFACRPPLELRRLGRRRQCLPGRDECLDIHAVIYWLDRHFGLHIDIGHCSLRFLGEALCYAGGYRYAYSHC